MGSPQLSVVAVIDPDGRHVRLVVTGPLTVDTQSALHPLIRLARVLDPVTRVVVDLSGTRTTGTAAVDELVRHAREGHLGHPSQQVRFVLPDPARSADAEDLRRLRAEQRAWTTSGADDDGTVRDIRSAPRRAEHTAVTGGARRAPGSSRAHRAAAERGRAAAGSAPSSAGTPHGDLGAAFPGGTVLPFRPSRHRSAGRTARPASVAGTPTG
ncbi:hypothetical protein QYM41_02385 [Kocuria sp. CPCC 205268]|uniref:hypothetical protein n=1 Tax=Kocuria oxytropis TaxID=3058913 RepID=UPI0034D4C881